MNKGKQAWSVRYDVAGGKGWRTTKVATVISDSAKLAIELLLKRYPDACVWAVNHKGGEEVIEDVGCSEKELDKQLKLF